MAGPAAVDRGPVLEHRLALQLLGVLRQDLGDLALHRDLPVGRHDQVGALHQLGLHLRRQGGLDQLEGQLLHRGVLDDVDRRLEGDDALLGRGELHRHAPGLQDLDRVEVARPDVDLLLLVEGRQGARVGRDGGEVRLERLQRLEARLDVGLRAAVHPGDLHEEAGAERRVQVGDADPAPVLGLPQVGPGGRRRLHLLGIVGQADDLEERRRAHRLLRVGDQVAVMGGLGRWVGLDEVLGDGREGGARIVQHHVDRRVGAGGLDLGDLVDREHRIEDDVAARALAEGRHQHGPVRLLPAPREGREDELARLRVGQAREGLGGAESQGAGEEAAAVQGHGRLSWLGVDWRGCGGRGLSGGDRGRR